MATAAAAYQETEIVAPMAPTRPAAPATAGISLATASRPAAGAPLAAPGRSLVPPFRPRAGDTGTIVTLMLSGPCSLAQGPGMSGKVAMSHIVCWAAGP